MFELKKLECVWIVLFLEVLALDWIYVHIRDCEVTSFIVIHLHLLCILMSWCKLLDCMCNVHGMKWIYFVHQQKTDNRKLPCEKWNGIKTNEQWSKIELTEDGKKYCARCAHIEGWRWTIQGAKIAELQALPSWTNAVRGETTTPELCETAMGHKIASIFSFAIVIFLSVDIIVYIHRDRLIIHSDPCFLLLATEKKHLFKIAIVSRDPFMSTVFHYSFLAVENSRLRSTIDMALN